MIPSPSTANAPPFKVVAAYFLASLAFFLALCAGLIVCAGELHDHYFQPHLLAVTHVATLGWISMAMFGAMMQLVPVVLQVRLFSARLTIVQIALYVPGVAGLAASFWMFALGVPLLIAVVLIVLAVILFVWNIVATMLRVTVWDLTGYFLVAGLIYLSLTVAIGATLAVNLGHPFISRSHLDYLAIHAHFGLVGWVLMVIMGVALRLVPMFTIAHGFGVRPAWVAFWCLNVGLLGTMVERTFGATLLFPVYAALIAVGLGAYVWQLVVVFRVRLRRALDAALRHTTVAFAAMIVAALLGYAAVFAPMADADAARLALAYGVAVIVGFVTSLIVGQMYKIVPFLVWFAKYSSKAGTQPVPMLRDLISEPLARGTFWLMTAAMAVLVAGVAAAVPLAITVGAVALAIGAAGFVGNIGRVFTR